MFDEYLKNITDTYLTGDATEPSYYYALKKFIEKY